MDVHDYYQGVLFRLQQLRARESLPYPDDKEQVNYFLQGLNRAKFSSLIDNITRGLKERPKTILEAYHMASKWWKADTSADEFRSVGNKFKRQETSLQIDGGFNKKHKKKGEGSPSGKSDSDKTDSSNGSGQSGKRKAEPLNNNKQKGRRVSKERSRPC
jgi:hypothetical protein